MNDLGICGLAVSLPTNFASVTSLPEYRELSSLEKRVFDQCGIESVPIAAPGSTFELLQEAAVQALADAQTLPSEVGAVLVLEPRLPERLLVSDVARICHVLGIGSNLAFRVGGLGCVDFNLALLIATNLLAASADTRDILIVHTTGEAGPFRFRYPVTIHGDAASAVVVSRSRGMPVTNHELERDGQFWDLFSIDYRGKPFSEWREECRDFQVYGFNLSAESRRRFRNILASDETHGTNNSPRVIMQNASRAAFAFFEQSLDLTVDPVCLTNLRRFGHLGATDITMNLLSLREEMRGSRTSVLVLNASPVAAWATMTVRVS